MGTSNEADRFLRCKRTGSGRVSVLCGSNERLKQGIPFHLDDSGSAYRDPFSSIQRQDYTTYQFSFPIPELTLYT